MDTVIWITSLGLFIHTYVDTAVMTDTTLTNQAINMYTNHCVV